MSVEEQALADAEATAQVDTHRTLPLAKCLLRIYFVKETLFLLCALLPLSSVCVEYSLARHAENGCRPSRKCRKLGISGWRHRIGCVRPLMELARWRVWNNVLEDHKRAWISASIDSAFVVLKYRFTTFPSWAGRENRYTSGTRKTIKAKIDNY